MFGDKFEEPWLPVEILTYIVGFISKNAKKVPSKSKHCSNINFRGWTRSQDLTSSLSGAICFILLFSVFVASRNFFRCSILFRHWLMFLARKTIDMTGLMIPTNGRQWKLDGIIWSTINHSTKTCTYYRHSLWQMYIFL